MNEWLGKPRREREGLGLALLEAAVAEAAHRHGKKACMHCGSAAFAAGAVKRGFDLVMLTSDLQSMVAGLRRQLDDLKAALA